MADILASSLKIVFVLLSFSFMLFPVGIGVSVSYYICGDVSSNCLSISSCWTHCCRFSVSDSLRNSLSVDRKKESFSFWGLFISNNFLSDQFIYCTLNQITGTCFCFLQEISNCGNVWSLSLFP